MAATKTFDQASAEALLKQLYNVKALNDLSYSSRPFFALVPKKGGNGGLETKLPLAYASSQGLAPSVEYAKKWLASQDLTAFLVRSKVFLSVANIDGLTLESSVTSMQAFASGAKMLIDSSVKRLANAVSSGLFRDGTGIVAKIASISVAGEVQLANPDDSVQFEVNMPLQAVASGATLDTGASPPSSAAAGSFPLVKSIDRVSGKMFLSLTIGGATLTAANLAAITNGLWVANSSIVPAGFVRSAVPVGSTQAGTKQIDGLEAWLTDDSTALSTAFNGVIRSSDPLRLGGIVYDGSTLSVKDAIINAMNLVSREGGRPDTCVVSYETYTQLAMDLQNSVVYTSLEGPGKISFSGFRFMSSGGEIVVIADRDVPPKTAYLLQLDTWVLLHANTGEVIFLDDNGVGEVLRTTEDADSRQVRAKAYLNLACTAPGWNAKIKTSV